jgi:hypothetical protein
VWLCGWFRGWNYDVYLHHVYPEGLVALGKMSPRGSRDSGVPPTAGRKQGGVLVLGRDMADLCRQNYDVVAEKIQATSDYGTPGIYASLAHSIAFAVRTCTHKGTSKRGPWLMNHFHAQ